MPDKNEEGAAAAPAAAPEPAAAAAAEPHTGSGEGAQAAPEGDSAAQTVVLDLEEKPSSDDPSSVPSPQVEAYNPEKAQETTRGNIALALILILALVITFAFCYLWNLPLVPATKEYTANLVSVLQIIFGPIVALVGTALGYYFGSKGNGRG